MIRVAIIIILLLFLLGCSSLPSRQSMPHPVESNGSMYYLVERSCYGGGRE